jgi:hypothetical protein
VDALGTVNPAIKTAKRLLLPVSPKRWLQFGALFFMQACVENGGGCGSYAPLGEQSAGGPGTSTTHGDDLVSGVRHYSLDELSNWLKSPSFIGLVLLLLFFYGIAAAIGSVGQAYTLRAVVSGSPQFTLDERCRSTSTQMFKFHMLQLALGVLGFVPALLAASDMLNEQRVWETSDVALIVLSGLFLTALAFIGAVVRNFVLPLSWRFEMPLYAAYRMLTAHPKFLWRGVIGAFLLHFVFSIVAYGVAVPVMMLAFFLGFLPVLHQTVLAPYLIFHRAHTLHILASMDADYAMID